MNLLVTGGSGFVGSNLISSLKDFNHYNILNIDKRSSAWHDNITVKKDITDPEFSDDLNFSPDQIIHLAAEHRDDVTPKSLYYDVNVKGTQNIIDFAKSKNVNSIIFFSSVAVYGFADLGSTENSKINPFNDYGISKFKAELLLRQWHSEDPLKRKLVIIRPTVIFGPRNRGNFYNLINQINSNKFLMVGNGKNFKSLAFIDNIVEFVVNTLSFPFGDSYLYNYVDTPESDMNSIINTIYKGLGKTKPKLSIPFYLAYFGASFLDLISFFSGRKFPVSRIRIKKFCSNTSFSTSISDTGFVAPYTIESAILKTVHYEFISNENDGVFFYTE